MILSCSSSYGPVVEAVAGVMLACWLYNNVLESVLSKVCRFTPAPQARRGWFLIVRRQYRHIVNMGAA